MKVKIVSEKENVLLKRKEVVFEVNHQDVGSTPPRMEVKKALANLLGVDQDLVFIKRYETKTGTLTALGRANIYSNIEQAKSIEPEYILKRNLPPVPQEEKGKETPKEEMKEEKMKEKKEESSEEPKEEQ
jgi:small subunit ribosomal protein S24e